jgi:phenylpropionate dioxygenase-like ring-hydroxylating dioxygenase large terminal subunit
MSIDEEELTDLHKVEDRESSPGRPPMAQGADEQRTRLGLRDRIPALGLTEYWYPAIHARKISYKKPVGRKLLGEDIVFFRGKKGDVVALENWCPHRNGSLSHGKCIFAGTITCPYHGLTLSEKGEAVAFLGEGPQSKFTGQPGTSARSYPTRTLKGIVFIWMGTGEPAAIEEDVPPEFFDESALVQVTEDRWRVNWRASLENLQDGHVYFVHRNSLELLMQDSAGLNLMLHMGANYPPTQVVNGRALVFENPRFFDFVDGNQARKSHSGDQQFQDVYPQFRDGKWPKTMNRKYLAQVMGTLRKYFRPHPDWLVDDVEWAQGAHLPSTFRLDYQTHIYSRAVTPDDNEHSWIFYYNTTYPRSTTRRYYNKFIFHGYYNWKQHKNFSGQDKRIVESLNYERPHEKFSRSDAFPLAWRRMVIEYARRPPSPDNADAAH